MNEKLPYRQIHLDFHTSPNIFNIGENFSREEFAQTLRTGHVNSINLFAKCHHGMFYYPTKIGTMHPDLKFDLFGEQVSVCRENGIRVGAYTCVAWCEDWANRHPEWLIYNYDGLRGGLMPFKNHFTRWNCLCIGNIDYRKVIKAELKEIYDNYKPDAYWIDIIFGNECVCPNCQTKMLAMGINPEDRQGVRRFDKIKEIEFCRDIYAFITAFDPKLGVYFNSNPYLLDNAMDEMTSSMEKRKYFSFVDIESLPSDVWGYNHFPIAANYIGKYSTEICMMNGKFHFSWADFGTLRNEEAMEYECFRAIAYGAKICMGDQLHPSGKLEPAVYERIGKVFSSVEKKEKWLYETKKVCEVGVFITSQNANTNASNLTEEGVYQVLSELHIPFDYLNCHDTIDKYKLLILPDYFAPTAELCKRISKFVENGGKVLLTGCSGVDEITGKYELDFIEAEFLGESEFDNRYIRMNTAQFSNIPAIDHVTYEKGYVIRSDEEALAMIVNPYFNRTYNQFSSHCQTAPKPDASDEPAVIKGKNYILISSPLFSDYANSRYQAHRLILEACINMLVDKPLISCNLPAITEVTVRENNEGYVLHLLNYIIQRKAKRLDTIEERYYLNNAKILLRMDYQPSEVIKVPDLEPLQFTYQAGYTEIELGTISGHTMILIKK